MRPRVVTIQVILSFHLFYVFHGHGHEAEYNPDAPTTSPNNVLQNSDILSRFSLDHAYKAEDLSEDVTFLGVILSSFHLSPVGIRHTNGYNETLGALTNIEKQLSGGQYEKFRRLDSPTHCIDIGVIQLPDKFTRIPLARVIEKNENGKVTEIWEVFWNTNKRMEFLRTPLEENSEVTKLGDRFADLLYHHSLEDSFDKASEMLSDNFEYKTLSLNENRLSVKIGTKSDFIDSVKQSIHNQRKKTNLIGSWSSGQYFIHTGEHANMKMDRTTFLQVLEFDPNISRFVRMKLWEVTLDI